MTTLNQLRTQLYHPLVQSANNASKKAWDASKKFNHRQAEMLHNEAIRLHKQAMSNTSNVQDKQEHQNIINKHSQQAMFHASNTLS